MAELFAGAFLSSSFQVIFEKLASVDIRDYFGGNKLDDLVKELDIKLNSINHVLEEAEIKQYQNTHVKKWLDELKHVLYEADQVLDEIATDAMLKKMKAESEPVTTSVLSLFSALTITNPFEYRINELLEKLELLADQKKDLGLEDGPSASKEGLVSWKPAKTLSTTSLVDESTIHVRDVRKQELINILLEGNDSGNQVPSIISIVGLGGMGKTTLAKLVYNDKKIKEHFQLEAWVYVSESFNDVGLTKAILKSFGFSADGEDLSLLQNQLQHELTGKKYLLVLDDIWNWNGNAACWENLLLPFNHRSSGSKIIVTTREKKVENVLNSKLFDLQQLDKSDCWRLFETHAFHGRNKCEYPDLKLIGKKIVKKCGGLPLAIKTLGQLLRRKFSEPEWMKILETDMGRLSDEDNKVNPVLRLSYHSLPSNHKRCFAYCSILPKGCEFGKGGLINIWMAEGLLKCCEAYESEEEFGSQIFNDLESISFFQKSLSHKFVMHDLVNDLAKSVSGEFCKKIDGAWVEGNLERTRHIWCSLELNCVDKLLEPICEVKGLRSLILVGDKTMLISSDVQRDLFSRLTCLRMLIFSGCGLSKLVDEIGNLKLLRYLELAENKITSLPDTICALYNLQTLSLEKCDKLTELPSNFSKLINLRHLELPNLKKMPKNIGKLTNLQTLNYFIVEEQNGPGIKELANMNNLHGTIKITGLGNVIDPADAAMANLKDKKYLEELYMVFDGRREEMMNDSIVESTVSVLEALQPNSNLKKLTIENYNGNRFSNWLRGSDLPNLVSLKLKNCGLCSDLPPHGQFPLLKELYIGECPELKRVPPQHLPSLQKLEISCCDKLEECLYLEGSPLLVNVSIKNCSKLKRTLLPQHLPSLQKLNICDCEMLEASIPKGDSMIELVLQKCDRILVNGLSTGLKKFVLCENRCTEFSEEQNLVNCSVLEELSFDLRGFVVKHPSLDLLCYNSLCELVIRGCDSSSLPFSLHLFTNLHSLKLYDCPQLESFPRGGLPSNLRELVISNCPKLISSREEWGLFQLNSLKWFSVSDEFENVESFPEENLLPPTLEVLYLYNCSKLRRMNNKGFLHLNSLNWLWIDNCPSLESLPEEGLQQLSSLSQLETIDCPIIREKYKKEGGERWHTISRIPDVSIYP
ncbi:putative disease resistance RPP13 protein [Trifolium repens]|nr:putative disease resistance RPP13 protein [Trifolium repens]